MNRLLKAILILNLEIVLLVPSCVQQKTDRGLKTSDQYWAETGLGTGELESLLADRSCYSGQQSFLACVNAVQQMAERFNLTLGSDGELVPIQIKDIADRVSEKKELSKWLPHFQKEEVSPTFSFMELWHQINTRFIKGPERSSVIAAGINGFLSVYKDPHTYLMPLAMYEEVVSNSESRNTNVGFVARRNNDGLLIRKVYEGSPAEKAGLAKGDRVLAINGKKVAEILPSKVSDLLKMRYSERIGFQIERKTNSGLIKKFVEVMKTEMAYPSVIAKVIEGPQRIGLLTIHKFSKNVCALTKNKITELREQNVRGIMMDLRDNPGGQVDEAACIANLFLDKGIPIFETRYLNLSKPSDKYVTENDAFYKGPLAVLINSGSASASEIVAGVLRDQGRTKLIGEKSFGKGSFQDGRVWGPNAKIALFQTEGLYYFASGWTPQLIGLEPDIAVRFNDADNAREQELFFNPIMPSDNWVGPQSLSWLTEKECGDDLLVGEAFAATASADNDPQMRKAQAWLSCGVKHDHHGSL